MLIYTGYIFIILLLPFADMSGHFDTQSTASFCEPSSIYLLDWCLKGQVKLFIISEIPGKWFRTDPNRSHYKSTLLNILPSHHMIFLVEYNIEAIRVIILSNIYIMIDYVINSLVISDVIR